MRDAELPQERAFAIVSGGGEDFGPGTLRDLNGSQADAARRSMNQDPVAWPDFCQMFECIAGRQERGGQRGRLFRVQIAWPARDQAHVSEHESIMASRCERNYRIPGGKSLDSFSDGHDLTRAFASQRTGKHSQDV